MTAVRRPAASRSVAPGRLLAAMVAAACAVVPCLFTTRLRDVFSVPKLAALWLVLIAGLLTVAVARVVGAPSDMRLRWVPAVDIAAVAFLLLNVLAALFSTDRHQSVFGERLQHQGLLTTLLYGGLYLLTRAAVSDRRRLELLFAGITCGAAAVAGYGLLQRIGLDPIWDGYLPEGRIFSTIGQPNALAAYLVIALPPAAALAVTAKGAVRVLVVVALAGIATATVLTLSRGGFLGLALLATLLPVLLLRGRRRLAALAVALAAVAAGIAVLSRRRGQGSLSTRNHLDSWGVAVRIARDHPLLGSGQDTFPDQFPRYSHGFLAPDRVAYFDAFRVESAHNVYLTMAANTGALSLLAYLAVIGGTLVLVTRAAGATSDPRLRVGLIALVAAAAAHLVTDSFMTAEIISSWLFWTLLGACASMASGFAEWDEGASSPRV